MQDKTIVAFLDILGYDSLVTRMITDVDFIKRFEELTNGIIKFKEDLINSERPDLSNEDKRYLEKVASSISIRYIYDNFIFSLPLSDIVLDSSSFDKNATVLNCIETFFSLIAMSATFFIAKMGYVFRGGISVGTHYEAEREHCLFIFSEAHNKAVDLERQAKDARILLDDNLGSQLEKMGFTQMKKFFYKDDDGRLCFDIYSLLPTLRNPQDVLSDIKEGVTLNIESNSTDEERLPKLIYFAKYHNRKVGKNGMNFPQLSININDFG